MGRPGPKLSKNPGKTAKFYRKNPEARKKHQETNKKINSTPAKREYRRNLMKIRRERGTGPQTDLSHKNGKIVEENRKTNRGRGGAQRR
jgi:hypothetical protein